MFPDVDDVILVLGGVLVSCTILSFAAPFDGGKKNRLEYKVQASSSTMVDYTASIILLPWKGYSFVEYS